MWIVISLLAWIPVSLLVSPSIGRFISPHLKINDDAGTLNARTRDVVLHRQMSNVGP